MKLNGKIKSADFDSWIEYQSRLTHDTVITIEVNRMDR